MLFGEFPLEQDLSALNKKLHQRRIPHRFSEEDGVQKLWLEDATHVAEINAWLSDPSLLSSHTIEFRIKEPKKPFFDVSNVIITLVIIVSGALGYLLAKIGSDFILRFAPLNYLFHSWEFWRLWTPAFIHFGEMHILFNALWIWEVGKRLEPYMGKLHYLGLFLLSAILANMAEYGIGGHIGFGGLSGVVYGYFGCIYFLSKSDPRPMLTMPPGIYVFMLVWLVIGFVGVIDFFINGKIANWAHLGGLVGGVLYAWIYQLTVRKEK